MSKGKWTHPDVKKYYISRALQERKEVKDGKVTLAAVVKRVTKELKDKGKTPPAPSTLTREMSLIINREASPEDEPWHMGTFKVYNPSTVGLAAIWKAYGFVVYERVMCRRRGDLISANELERTVESDSMLTIRQAKWIARLDPLVRMSYAQLEEEVLVALVIDWAIFYAEDEILSEVMGVPFKPLPLDRNLVRGVEVPRLDGWGANHFKRQVFANLLRTKRTGEEMKRSFDDPLEREFAELTAGSKKRKLGDTEFWDQYHERLNSIIDREESRMLDELEREEEEHWQKRIGATNPQLCNELASAFRAAAHIELGKPPARWTDEDRRTVDEFNRLEAYAESLEKGQDKEEPAKRGKKSKKGAKK